MATIYIDGRQIPLDDAIAGNDELLKQALLPHLPEIANATISREQKNGQMIVTLVKRAGTKGVVAGLSALIEAPERVNPIFGMAWMLRWKEARGELDFMTLYELQVMIDATLEQGETEEKHTRNALRRLKQAPACVSTRIMVGF